MVGKLGMPLLGHLRFDPVPHGDVAVGMVVWVRDAPESILTLRDGHQISGNTPGRNAPSGRQFFCERNAHARGRDDDGRMGVAVGMPRIEPHVACRKDVVNSCEPRRELRREDHPLGSLLGSRPLLLVSRALGLLDGNEITQAVEPVKGISTHGMRQPTGIPRGFEGRSAKWRGAEAARGKNNGGGESLGERVRIAARLPRLSRPRG